MLTSWSQHGMLSQAISYIGASVSSVVSLSVPSSGGLSLTVTGRNGGQAVYSAGIRIGASAAQATLWLSDSASIAKSSAGLEIALYVSISMSRWSTLLALSSCISYAAPIASSVRLTNFPSSGATIVSIFGSGLGGIAGSAKVRAGSTACSSSIWRSFSSISCKVASGNDRSSSVQLSAGFMTMSQVLLRFSGAASYDMVSVASVHVKNSPTSGSVSVTFSGASSGYSGYSPRAAIGTGFVSSRWVSSSSTLCKTVSGVGGSRNVLLSVDIRVSTLSNHFSFDTPGVYNQNPMNLPKSGSISVTLVGYSSGFTRPSSAVAIDASACSASVWLSDSSVATKPMSGSAIHLSVTTMLSVAVQRGSITSLASYDIQQVSSLGRYNGPRLGNIVISVLGTSIGTFDLSPSARLGASACTSSVWITSSSITCKLSSGFAAALPVVSTAHRKTALLSQAFSYDVAIISSVKSIHGNAPATGSLSVSVFGLEFGTTDTSEILKFGSTRCMATAFVSDTSLSCKVAAGSADSIVSLDSALSVGPGITQALRYDAPNARFSNPSNIPSSGAVVLTLSGNNFSPWSISSMFVVHGTSCEATSWISDSSSLCKTPRGVMTSFVSVNTSMLQMNNSAFVVFDRPIPAIVHSRSVPGTGSSFAMLSGSSLGAYFSSACIKVGSTSSEMSVWISLSAVAGRISSGVSDTLIVRISVNLQTSSASALISYETALNSITSPSNAPATGSVFVSISGVSYGQSSFSHSSWVGLTLAVSSIWISDSSVVAKMPAFSDKSVMVASQKLDLSFTNQSVLFADNPRIHAVVPSVYGIRGGKVVTLIGRNFGVFNQNNQSLDSTSLFVKFAGNAAYNASWISDSSVLSTVPPGIISNGSTISVEMTTFQRHSISHGLTAYTGINVSSVTPGLFTAQSFGNASFSVNLFFQPTADVTITVSSLVPSRAKVLTPTLVFTPSSFSIPQIAHIQGVPNVIQEGNTFYNITMSLTSQDSDYDGLYGRVFEFALTGDIDVAGVVFSPNFVAVQEPSSSFVFNITLRSQPLENVSFALVVGNVKAAFLTPILFHFAPIQWNTPQSVTIQAIDDMIAQGTRFFNVSAVNFSSTDPFYNNLQHRHPQNYLVIAVQDNDVAGARYTERVQSVRKDDQMVLIPRQPSMLYVNITSEPIADVNATALVQDSEAAVVVGSQYFVFTPQN